MNRARICCLDLEGVLVPEIWIAVAEKTHIPELKRTTRDEPDYDVLMRSRLNILKEKQISLADIEAVIAHMGPLTGAKEFLANLKIHHQVVIMSDTFYEFAHPLMQKLGHPTLFCNSLEVDEKGFISNYHLRQPNGKEKAVVALKGIGFEIVAAGDSYNDLTMLKSADRGIWFRAPKEISDANSQFSTVDNYTDLLEALKS